MSCSIANRPAYQHACTFATAEGKLTTESIAKGQASLQDTGAIADVRREAVLSACGAQPTVERICSFANRARSGIWNEDGTLNIDRLAELKKRCITTQEGTLAVTRSMFQNFIEERRAQENQGCLPNILEFGNLTRVRCILPIPYTLVTDGSVDALFHRYADCQIQGEKAMAWDKVCQFYDPENISQLCESSAK